jgi:D-alanyl-D-alanine carboxypeptidase/D-alanyl-D-alanine-endopeptidase (penicillin-binding protein 4)
MSRDWNTNAFRFYKGPERKEKKFSIPFVIDSLLIPTLLQDTLQREVVRIQKPVLLNYEMLYSVHADSLYKVMMVESDNFIAEQLLFVCASILGDSINSEIPIRYMMNRYLNDLPDKPIIKDGSGLSRYNLVTPRTMVSLWKKLYNEVPKERLFKLLATGGKSGTVKNNYKESEPYIFGKTGTLSNVHCLSGFLITKKNRMLIFSYMNTNFTQPTRDVKSEMELLLKTIHDNY